MKSLPKIIQPIQKQVIFVTVVHVKRRAPDVCLIQDILYGDPFVLLVGHQRNQRLMESLPGFLNPPIFDVILQRRTSLIHRKRTNSMFLFLYEQNGSSILVCKEIETDYRV